MTFLALWQSGLASPTSWFRALHTLFPSSWGEEKGGQVGRRMRDGVEGMVATLPWSEGEKSAYLRLYEQLKAEEQLAYGQLLHFCEREGLLIQPQELQYPLTLVQEGILTSLRRPLQHVPLFFSSAVPSGASGEGGGYFSAFWFLPFLVTGAERGGYVDAYGETGLTLVRYERGEEEEAPASLPHRHRFSHHDEEVLQLEVNLDDMNPELVAYVMERLLAVGVNDVYLTAIMMKKNRMGTQLQCLLQRKLLPVVEEMIFTETSSPGFRYYPVTVHRLGRQMAEVSILGEVVRLKEIIKDGVLLRRKPEYEDCAQIARKYAIPLQDVYRFVQGEVLRKWGV